MTPANRDRLHVHSTRVLVGGELRAATVVLEAGRVASIEPLARDADERLGDELVVPAPLDLHLHGAGGHVVPPGGDVAAIDAALTHPDGPTYEWVATLPIPGIDRGADVLDSVAREVAAASRAITAAREATGTGCVGLRIEGLFLNPARAGVWPPEAFLPPLPTSLDVVARAAADEGTPLRIVDVAPEADFQGESSEFIARARELGIVASLAHTDASWEQARTAIDAGATLATHVWNAMRPVGHRDPGVVAAVLADPRVTCELICDGAHLHPGTIELSVAACGRGGWIAVSDASPFAGCSPGTYEWAGTTVTHDGSSLRDAEGRLAGSASTLLDAWDTLRLAGVPDVDAAIAMGAAPRRVLDPQRPLGLVAGDPAWIVGFGRSSDRIATR